MVQLSDGMSTSFRHSHLTGAFSFTGLTSSSVFTDSQLKNMIIDKRLSLPPIQVRIQAGAHPAPPPNTKRRKMDWRDWTDNRLMLYT